MVCFFSKQSNVDLLFIVDPIICVFVCLTKQTLIRHLSTKISIGTETVFSLNLDKMSKIDILNGIQIRISLKTFF